MTKDQKTLHDLMLNILGFGNFRQNDVVETFGITKKANKIERVVMNSGTDISLLIDSTFRNNKDLKFTSRDFTLNDLLMAFHKVREFHTYLGINNKGYMEYWDSTTEEDSKQWDYDLTKNVLEQDNLKEIIEVLK